MHRSKCMLTAAAIFSVAGASVIMTYPAEARSGCTYFATNGSKTAHWSSAEGYKMKVACRRAKRRCERKLRRNPIGRGTQTSRCVKGGTSGYF